MKKFLVDVYIPAVNKHMDVFLPAGKLISEATGLLAGLAESIYAGSYKGTRDAILLDAVHGNPFNREITVFDAGIRNASKLLLI